MASIPASAVVQVTPSVIQAGGSALDLITIVLTDSPLLPTGDVRSFPTTQAVAAYFGYAANELLIAATYFLGFANSNKKPGSLLFASYATAPRAPFLRGANISGIPIASLQQLQGGLSVSINGTLQASGNISLSAATSYTQAAGIIGTAIGAAVTWDSTTGAFTVTGPTTGLGAVMDYATGTLADALGLSAQTAGTLSQGADPDTAQEALDQIIAQTNNWATLMTSFEPTTADKVAFAAWTNAQTLPLAYICWDTDILATVQADPTVPPTTAAGLIEQANYSGTVMIYAPVNQAQLGAFVCGTIASIDFTERNGRTNLKFRGQSGLAADVTNYALAQTLTANGYNYFGAFAAAKQGFTFFAEGTISGEFFWIDSYINDIWLTNAMQLSLLEFLTQSKSVPYSQPGYAGIEAALGDPIRDGLNFGAIRTGVVLSDAQIAAVNNASGLNIADSISNNGYYLDIKDPGAQVRGARGSPLVTLYYCDGGSVNTINVSSTEIQ